MSEVTVNAKWFRFGQNNSGGYFIQDEMVDADVFIQAINASQAVAIAEQMFECRSEYCECCGERWSTWVDDSDGTDEPEIYGEKITNMKSSWHRTQARLHYLDGRNELFVYKKED